MGAGGFPNSDPFKVGCTPQGGAVSTDGFAAIVFSNTLVDDPSLSGIEATLTCFNESDVLKTFELDGTGNPAVMDYALNQLRLRFDVSTGVDPIFDYPCVDITDVGNLMSTSGDPARPGTAGIIDIG
jgi:hypothetical protein